MSKLTPQEAHDLAEIAHTITYAIPQERFRVVRVVLSDKDAPLRQAVLSRGVNGDELMLEVSDP